MLRRIFGPVNERGTWRVRDNYELYGLYKETKLSDYKAEASPMGRACTENARIQSPQKVYSVQPEETECGKTENRECGG